MHSKRYIRLFVIAGFAFVASLAYSKEMQRIADGVWGGQHIQVDVSSESAKVEFDCAHGTIEGPLTVDANGDFSWRGTFARERGGPITSDDKDLSQPAVYSGSIKEQTMTMAVRLASEKEPLDTFVLTRGKAGQIRKCR
jgi:hypothetical protein